MPLDTSEAFPIPHKKEPKLLGPVRTLVSWSHPTVSAPSSGLLLPVSKVQFLEIFFMELFRRTCHTFPASLV